MNQPATKKVPFSTWGIVAVAAGMWLLFGALSINNARIHDFLNIYTGSSLARDGMFATLHDPAVQLAREQTFVPQTHTLVPFPRPLFYALFLAPLSWLFPFGPALTAWVILQIAALAGCLWAGRRMFGPDALTFGALYLPTAMGIANGQDCVLVLAVFIGAYAALKNDRPMAAGLILSLGLFKFHLLLLWPFAMLLSARFRMLTGFVIGGAAEALLTLALGGFEGARRYVELLQNKDLDRLSPTPEFMVNAQSLAANFAGGSTAVAVGIGVVVFAVYLRAAWKAPLWRWWSATAAAGLLIVPHVYAYDASLLLLPLWLAIFSSTFKATRITAGIAAMPIPFMLTLADRPWSGGAALAILAFLAALGWEAVAGNEGRADRYS